MSATSTAPLTNSPIRASDVDFRTHGFEMAHGKRPSGRGSWAFVDYDRRNSSDYLDHVKWFNDVTYGEAKRAAAKAFAAEGVMSVEVCS